MNQTVPPIAVVGMACRFPKGLENLKVLWEALVEKFSAIDEVPADRWTADRYHSSNPQAKGKMYMRRGGFLTHPIEQFDPAFFGISPRDAENMDPQQRLLLEVVWEAFENAGISLPAQAKKAVGVYVGGFMLDHMISQMSAPNRSAINQHTAAGMMMTMLSNRISHTFDLRGPSLSIDTACSSSLVAFHFACQDLWRGATKMAVVGGANCMLRPEYPMGMCKGHFLSRDGECKSFDDRADGYGRGEGAGAVLLKPLAEALQDGDPILATVIGTGTNQDGRTPGISMPSGEAQRDLIQEVCSQYNIDPSSVHYVECHGTGTAIGDPTESRAIAEVYGRSRHQDSPVIIGSIKSNIGHLEAAAGVAGVIKAVLTLMHRQATPIANLCNLNPAIDQQSLNIRIADQLLSLGEPNVPVRAAVNSFGYGGSNAHVILESADHYACDQAHPEATKTPAATEKEDRLPLFCPISARSDQSLMHLAERYQRLLSESNQIEDVLYSASHRRAHLSHRAIVMGANRQELIDGLASLARNEESPQIIRGTQPFSGERKPVFVFTGMGPQWWAMGQELYREQPVYREAVEEADQAFRSVSGFSVLSEMLKPELESRITRTEFAQPANFIIQIGLLACLKAAGVEPGAVVGHSVGELASAYAAGALTLRDAMTVCFHRSRLQATCIGTGSMMAIGLSKEKTIHRITRFGDRISVAAANGPNNVTVAGDTDLMNDLATELAQEQIFHKFLDVEVPYHSPMMDPILHELQDTLRSVRPSVPSIPLYSTVSGSRVLDVQYGADYWPKNVRQSVELESSIQALLADGYQTFLEVGPHPVLATSIRDCCKQAGVDGRQLYTLRKGHNEHITLNRAIAGVFAMGCDIDWTKKNGFGKFIALPNYPWHRDRFWMENDRAMQDRIATITLPMLGNQEAPGTPAWRNDFDHEPVHYLRDHVVTGVPILPAAGYIESMFELLIHQAEPAKSWSIRNLEISAAMMITVERGLDCVTSYDPKTRNATIRSLESGRLGTGQIHATGNLVTHQNASQHIISLPELIAEFDDVQDAVSHYRDLERIGLQYGPAFQTIRELRLNADRTKVLCRLEMQSELKHQNAAYHVHPTLLDGCFQSLMAMLGNSENTYLPARFAEIHLLDRNLPESFWCLGEKVEQNDRYIDCDLTLIDVTGRVIGSIHGMRSMAAARRERVDQFGDRVKRQILAYEWHYDGDLSEPKRLGHWMVIGNPNGLQQEVAHRLESFGARVVANVQFGNVAKSQGTDYVVRKHDVEDFKHVLQNCGDLDGIVFLEGLQSRVASSDPTGEESIQQLVASLQAYLAVNSETVPRFYVLTQCAFATENHDSPVQPGQTAVNGVVRVAFNELDGLRLSSIDLPATLDDDVLHLLTLELICDDSHDEVAIRGNMRMVSELRESSVLNAEAIDYRHLDETNPIKIRPVDEGTESIGTAKIIASHPKSIGAEDLQICVESTVVPPSVLAEYSEERLAGQRIEIVGRLLGCGASVPQMSPGKRVAGFAPFEVQSHLVGNAKEFFLVEVPDSACSTDIVANLLLNTRSKFVLENLRHIELQRALVVDSPLGKAIARGLLDRGVQVTFLSLESEASIESDQVKEKSYSYEAQGIHRAFIEQTQRQGFDLLVVDLSRWSQEFDFHVLGAGAMIVDLDDQPQPITLERNTRGLVRTDFDSMAMHRENMIQAMKLAVDGILSGTCPTSRCLEVTLYDLAWQRLPLTEVTGTLVLHYDDQQKDLPVVQAPVFQCRRDATYVVTGGFGGLGRKTAEWLISRGAKTIVLTGRKGADSPEKVEICDELQEMGCRIHAVACDTADYHAVQEMVQWISDELPPLKGVFHSGAVIQDQPIAEIDESTLKLVMRSKAQGAWNLHLATQSLELEQFVMYSSVANLVGNSRQAIYSAANGFLNGLAHYRRSKGLAALSVNWGAIADVGVVARDEKLEQFLRYTGLRGIGSAEGLSLLQEAIARQVVQFGVTVITTWTDWARFETRGCKSPRFATLIANDSETKDTSIRDALIEELATLDAVDQTELLASLIAEILASVLKAEASTIPLDRAINQLGVDSLMATEIQMLLDSKLGINISVLELIGESTIRVIANQARKTLMADEAMTVA